MKVCVLAEREIRRFSIYGIKPNCNEHSHLSVENAMMGIFDGEYDFVYGVGAKRPWIKPAKEHVLRVMPSGGIPIVQRVAGNGLLHIEEAR